MITDDGWFSILEFPSYDVNIDGKIRSRNPHRSESRVLKATPCQGYHMVKLHAPGRQKVFKVATLVMQRFVGERPKGMQINHVNGIKTDDRLENLKYVTPSENIRHAVRTGLKRSQKGEDHGMARLKEEQVLEIRTFPEYITHKELAEVYEVSGSTISEIRRHISWRHI